MSHVWMILLMTCCRLVRPQHADPRDTDVFFTQYPYVQEAPRAHEPNDFLYIYPYKKNNANAYNTNTHLPSINFDTNQAYEHDDTKYKRRLHPYSIYRKFKDLVENNNRNYEIRRQADEIKTQTNSLSNDDMKRSTNTNAQMHQKETQALNAVRKMNAERTDVEVKLKRNFSPWGGKRNDNERPLQLLSHNEWAEFKRAKIVPQNLKFNAWGGKRSNPIFKTEKFHKNKYIYTVNASKRIPFDAFTDVSFEEKQNRKLNKYHKCVGKRNNLSNQNLANNVKYESLPATNYRKGTGPRVRSTAPLYDASLYFQQGHWKKDGRRVETFSPWGGKRSRPEFEMSEPAWTNADAVSMQALEFEDDNTIDDFV